jgi:predicted transcriptional regulator
MRREVELPSQLNGISGRQRQLLGAIYARGSATAVELERIIPDAPSGSAIRTLLDRLTAKGYVTKRRALRAGRENIYVPGISTPAAKLNALKHISDEFFRGSLKSANRELVRLASTQIEADVPPSS